MTKAGPTNRSYPRCISTQSKRPSNYQPIDCVSFHCQSRKSGNTSGIRLIHSHFWRWSYYQDCNYSSTSQYSRRPITIGSSVVAHQLQSYFAASASPAPLEFVCVTSTSFTTPSAPCAHVFLVFLPITLVAELLRPYTFSSFYRWSLRHPVSSKVIIAIALAEDSM